MNQNHGPSPPVSHSQFHRFPLPTPSTYTTEKPIEIPPPKHQNLDLIGKELGGAHRFSRFLDISGPKAATFLPFRLDSCRGWEVAISHLWRIRLLALAAFLCRKIGSCEVNLCWLPDRISCFFCFLQALPRLEVQSSIVF